MKYTLLLQPQSSTKMPYSSRACFITPSLFQLHNVQHHTPAVPFLSIGDYIVAVYQKKGNKTEYLAAPIVEGDG